MIDLTKKALPNTVMVGGKAFSIYTDYRVWLRFMIEYENKVYEKEDWNLSYLFKNELPIIEDISDMEDIIRFAFNPNKLPNFVTASDVRAIDYEIDSELIYSAFVQQYGIDLIDIKEMHWHKFKALLFSITEPCKLATIINYRFYDGDNKDMKKARSEWELPTIYSEEEQQQIQEFNDYFG